MSGTSLLLPELERILDAIPRLRIGVAGDFCLDFYQFVDMSASEVSVETGLATLPVREVRYSLGGAGNVVNNLCAMGAAGVRCYGVVGRDPHGELLTSLLREAGADTSGVEVQEGGWLTQTYTKVIVEERENPRIDWGNFNVLSSEVEARLLERIARELPRLDLLIVNQQLIHGIHSQGFREELIRLLASAPSVRSIADSRDYAADFTGSLRKLNEHEAARLCNLQAAGSSPTVLDSPLPFEEAAQIATTLFERWGSPLLLTRGERGCIVRDEAGVYEIPGLIAPSRIDPVGAGDSMLAGTAAALAAGESLRTAATLGNLVAGVTVQKLHQTGTATAEEIRSYACSAAYRFRPELAAAVERATFLGGTEVEVVTSPPRGRRFAHAIFDNDGTLSTLRQGWEGVMEPMMVRSILGPAAERVDEASYRRVVERVREHIDRTTGVQTIEQMQGLVEMVREEGYVADDEVLDAAGYKRIYNTELMRLVDDRIRRLQSGELEPQDFLLKRAVEFVALLVERGLKVHLASGTDEADVRREAEALGYASLFGEAVHGSVGDVRNDPKKVVIEGILKEIGDAGCSTIVTFGDGPVEIRETQRRGGYAVGVASNELRRFGLDLTKRARLIQAGADLIVADFSRMGDLDRILFGDERHGTNAV